jgi:hypothetical protein
VTAVPSIVAEKLVDRTVSPSGALPDRPVITSCAPEQPISVVSEVHDALDMVNTMTVTDPVGVASVSKPLYSNPLTVRDGLETCNWACAEVAPAPEGSVVEGGAVVDGPPVGELDAGGSEVVGPGPADVDVGGGRLLEVGPGAVDEVGSVHTVVSGEVVDVESAGHGDDPAAWTAGVEARSGTMTAHNTSAASSQPIPAVRAASDGDVPFCSGSTHALTHEHP